MKDVRMSNTKLYKIIVKCEQREGPPQPSAHHVTGRIKKAPKKTNPKATRFSEHYRGIKKPRKIDNMNIKQTNHSISSIPIQPVERLLMIIIALKDIEIFLA